MNIEEIFTRAALEDGGFVRVSETHPANLFVGVENGARALMLLCLAQPPKPPHLAALAIERRQRTHGWALVVRLERPELRALFSHLADDLIEAVLVASEGDAADVIVAQLVRWQKLLSRAPSELLDNDALRGLAAELDFFVRQAATRVGAAEAVDAWRGPLAAPKDFVFIDVDVEVKARHRTSKRLRISSLDQLSDTGRPIFLWTRAVDLYPQRGPEMTNLSELVEAARKLVAGHPTAWEILELKLHAAGYADSPEYAERWLLFGDVECYGVGPAFPKLERVTTPAAIVECEYMLDIASLAAFVVPSWTTGD